MDIFTGLILWFSLISLEVGTIQFKRLPIIIFIITSLSVVTFYWVWFFFLKYIKEDNVASEEVKFSNVCLFSQSLKNCLEKYKFLKTAAFGI